MKTKLPFLAAAALLAAGLRAAPLPATTAVHVQADETSLALTFLKAGTEPAPSATVAPAGWLAVDLPGPFEGYVHNRDIQKNLDVRLGAPIRPAPRAEAGVLTTAEKDDKLEITGLVGKWTKLTVGKKITGYIRVGSPTVFAPAEPPRPAAPAPLSPAPVAPLAYGAATAGQAAPMVNLGDGGTSTLPRQFAGRFVSTRRPFAPRRPYDWALNDDAGVRYAYLDISRLKLTEPVEGYANHPILVFGAAKAVNNGRDLLIEVESLQLK